MRLQSNTPAQRKIVLRLTAGKDFMQHETQVPDIHKPEKENKLFLWRNLKDNTGHAKRECFRLEKDIKQLE